MIPGTIHKTLRARIQGSIVATIGYLLSPLSWWNDLYLNVPIAYLLAWPIGLMDKRLFGPFMIFFYWGTNLIGLLLLHKGLRSAAAGGQEIVSLRKRFLYDVLWSLAYSGILFLLIYAGVFRLPHEYFGE